MNPSVTYERKRVWSLLFRLYHWFFAFSITALIVTGFYITCPWTSGTAEGSGIFPVAEVRYWHFLSGYVFVAALMVRFYLLLFGNPQERIMDILPVNKRNIMNLFSTIARYSYVSDRHDHRYGHNLLAGMAYLATFAAGIVQIVSGFFLLFPESGFWQNWGTALFHTQQDARFVHHLTMWFFILFIGVHLYFAVWNDIRSPEGLISSIFNGEKFSVTIK
jgi:Ni/Fe-hydrogenase 1 B-type cytochrome subunit